MSQWIAELDTGRFGDWIIVEADTEEQARKAVKRRTRRPVRSVRESIPTRERLRRQEAGEEPVARRTRRR